MKKAAAMMAVVLALGSTVALDAEAKRLGGGRSGGLQRPNVTAPANNPGMQRNAQTAPTQAPAAGAPAAGAAAAAAAPKRSWMGPVAAIAGGLGLAALASHFGFGEALANMLTIALLAMAALALVGWFLRKRMAGQQPAMAGGAMPRAGGDGGNLFRREGVEPAGGKPGIRIGSGVAGGLGAQAPTASGIPADFDVAAFERNAKQQFLALQSANDTGDLQRLREYLTPEMLELVRAEIAERGAAPQQTEVFGLEAQVLDVAQEADRYIVSVRFTGGVRTQAGAGSEDLREIWHLTRSRAGLDGWVVAGIQQA